MVANESQDKVLEIAAVEMPGQKNAIASKAIDSILVPMDRPKDRMHGHVTRVIVAIVILVQVDLCIRVGIVEHE